MTEAKEEGDTEALARLNKRTQRVTPQHGEEAKKLLKLMGIPYVDAPCEAEAQCAEMVKSGLCYGSGSEDMDSLTLGVPLLIRHLNYSESRGLPILEIRLEKVLEGLGFDMDQFIDLCILLGCDYCDSIRGIGPVRAMQLIQKHKTIEAVLETLDREKYKVPENFPYPEIRELFRHPEVTESKDLDIKWTAPDEEGLIEFLVGSKGFSEDRVRRGIEKLNKSRSASVQDRITSFFQPAKTEKKEPPKKDDKSKKTAAPKKGAKASSSSAPAPAPKPQAERAPFSVPAPSAPEPSTQVKQETKVDPTPPLAAEPEVKGPVHPFFQPRKATAKKADSSSAPSSDNKPSKNEPVPTTEKKPDIVVKRTRIIEDDGDD